MCPPTVSDATIHTSGPVSLFYSCSDSQEDETLRKRLEDHLAPLRERGIITEWHSRMIGAGEEREATIDKHLEGAQVILLLVSAAFLGSDRCLNVEANRAMERHARGEARVIPVILRSCQWQWAPFGRLQALPTDGIAISSWPNKDDAFTNVAVGIRFVLEQMKLEAITERPGSLIPTGDLGANPPAPPSDDDLNWEQAPKQRDASPPANSETSTPPEFKRIDAQQPPLAPEQPGGLVSSTPDDHSTNLAPQDGSLGRDGTAEESQSQPLLRERTPIWVSDQRILVDPTDVNMRRKERFTESKPEPATHAGTYSRVVSDSTAFARKLSSAAVLFLLIVLMGATVGATAVAVPMSLTPFIVFYVFCILLAIFILFEFKYRFGVSFSKDVKTLLLVILGSSGTSAFLTMSLSSWRYVCAALLFSIPLAMLLGWLTEDNELRPAIVMIAWILAIPVSGYVSNHSAFITGAYYGALLVVTCILIYHNMLNVLVVWKKAKQSEQSDFA